MNVLITSAASPTGALLVAALQGEYAVHSTDLHGRASGNITACNLEHDEATDIIVSGIDAIVHVGYEGQDGGETALVDYHTRRTYNLLYAAASAGVQRVVNISTLRLYERYEENLTVTENWRPLPVASEPQLLACHLGEIVAKEFARDRLLRVLNLRLGFPFVAGNTAAANAGDQTAAVSTADITHSVARALRCELDYWQCVHIQSPVDEQRFITQRATSMGLLGEEVAA